jgi:hypothetical protein
MPDCAICKVEVLLGTHRMENHHERIGVGCLHPNHRTKRSRSIQSNDELLMNGGSDWKDTLAREDVDDSIGRQNLLVGFGHS